ncbi:hypothetical protein ILYODFUR_024841 [Ilyodon furcidens]|uniref:Uncharacterized protein n=1 Tax=Ilyodon furcidens TaxID=33524 RepID=A0ABV0V6V4_9TELE
MHHVVTPLNPTAPLDLNLQRFKELRAEGSRRPTAAHKLIYLERPLKHEGVAEHGHMWPCVRGGDSTGHVTPAQEKQGWK